jgi:phospholipase D1/2
VDLQAEFGKLSLATLNAFDLSVTSQTALKTLYGGTSDTVLFWAHHEKLLIVDSHVGFMGGLDLCTSNHLHGLSIYSSR